MISRAHILIQQEIADAEKDKQITITKVNEENVFELVVFIDGLPKTHWENGIFQVYMKFNEHYNFQPPCVYFQTIPYHPNIDMATGKPSVDFLDDKYKWRQDYSIKYIVSYLQNLLAFPLLDRAVNMDAVFMLKGNPSQYENIIKQSVVATQRISRNWNQSLTTRSDATSVSLQTDTEVKENPESKLRAYDIDLVKYFENENSEPEVVKNNRCFRKFPLFTLKDENQKRSQKNLMKSPTKSSFKKWTTGQDDQLKNISFDDYCTMWKGIATSKANKEDENVYLKTGLLENPKLLSQHLSISIKELEEQVYQQLNEHKSIMYGKFDFSNRTLDLKPFEKHMLDTKVDLDYELTDDRLQSMPGNNPSLKNTSSKNIDILMSNSQAKVSRGSHHKEYDLDDDFNEEEVDELINWTKNIVN